MWSRRSRPRSAGSAELRSAGPAAGRPACSPAPSRRLLHEPENHPGNRSVERITRAPDRPRGPGLRELGSPPALLDGEPSALGLQLGEQETGRADEDAVREAGLAAPAVVRVVAEQTKLLSG